ncbi:MAG: hypothetical protein ACLP4R_25510 [Solirubrobacteraceae bacterium]
MPGIRLMAQRPGRRNTWRLGSASARLIGKRATAWLGLAAVLGVLGAVAFTPPGAEAAARRQRVDGDTPVGFWYGTDSWAMPVAGTGPYSEPQIGGSYGGYIGMIGNWAWWNRWPGAFLVPTAGARPTRAAREHLGEGSRCPGSDRIMRRAASWCSA